MNARTYRIAQWAGAVEATAVFLFLYQALRVLFSVLFGLIYDALFAEAMPMTTVGLVLAVVVLALLTPLTVPRRPDRQRVALLGGAVVAFLARIPLTPNDPQSRLAASILIVAGAGLYLAARLREGQRDVVRTLVLALIADQVLRAAGHTWDVTLRPAWLGGQVAVSLGLCLLAGWLFRQRPVKEPGTGTGPGLLGGLAWGSWLFLETSLLNFPNALARWSGAPYAATAPLLSVITLLPLVVGSDWAMRRSRVVRMAGAAIFLGSLAVGGLGADPVISLAALLLARLLALLLLPACLFGNPGREGRPGIALGGILFLLWSFAYAFTFTYPYTIAACRGMGLPVVLAAGLLIGLPALRRSAATEQASHSTLARVAVALVAGGALLGMVLPFARPSRLSPPAAGSSLRVATYNIHYGYDTYWHLSLEDQARTLEASGADVVMLQEVDTGRPTSYMIDDALWLARRLNMEAVYLPTVEHLTGIALLTRYPILRSDTLLLPSELEQTGIIWAELDVGSTPLNAFAIWLGLEPEERARQLDAALPFIAAHPGPAVWGGDFNSTPDSPEYARICDAGFVDPFPALGLGSPPTDPAINPTKRIDFVWLRGLTPLDAQVLDSLASDHRPVVFESSRP